MLGIAGIGIAAMLGRLTSLAVLFVAIRGFVPMSTRLFAMIVAGSVVTLAIQVWVESDPHVSVIRLLVAVVGAGVLAWLGLRAIRADSATAGPEGAS